MGYTFTSPNHSPEDRVRFLIGDVEQDGVSIDDDVIKDLLAIDNDNVFRAALSAARHIRARTARLGTSRTVNGLSTSKSVDEMDKVIADINQQLNTAGGRGGIGVIGLTITDREEIEGDTDFIQPFAKEGRNVNRGSTRGSDS